MKGSILWIFLLSIALFECITHPGNDEENLCEFVLPDSLERIDLDSTRDCKLNSV